jgi:hypothetical protein
MPNKQDKQEDKGASSSRAAQQGQQLQHQQAGAPAAGLLARMAPWRGSSSGPPAAPPGDPIVLTADASPVPGDAAWRGRGGRKARKAAAGTAAQQAALGPAAGGPGGAGCCGSLLLHGSRWRPCTRRAVAALLCLAAAAAVAVGVSVALSRRGAGEELPPVDGFVVVRDMKVSTRGCCRPWLLLALAPAGCVEPHALCCSGASAPVQPPLPTTTTPWLRRRRSWSATASPTSPPASIPSTWWSWRWSPRPGT